jgi:tripartite-type tricarboxylate transporter receptor subunit TctC
MITPIPTKKITIYPYKKHFISTTGTRAEHPERPIRLIVSFGAGGPTDIPARFIADKLGARLKQNIVVENKTGASGLLATRYVLSQPQDGHTLLFCTHWESLNHAFDKSAGYQLSDVAPISLVTKYFSAVAVPPSLPVDTLEQFVRYAKARPGELNYSTVGALSPQEIVSLRLAKFAGITMTRVPFRTGTQIIPELLAGRVHLYVGPTLAVLPLYRDKKVKFLAVTSPQRLETIPEVPTLVEQGYDYAPFGWLGFCAGAKTPPAILETLSRHIVAITSSAEYRSLIEQGGATPVSSTPAELRRVLTQTAEEAVSIIREFGLQR